MLGSFFFSVQASAQAGYYTTKDLQFFVASFSHLQDGPIHLLGHFFKLRIIKFFRLFPLMIVETALVEGQIDQKYHMVTFT